MTPKYIYEVWAAPGGLWSQWVKPVLFSHMNMMEVVTADENPQQFETSWAPPADGRTVIVADLPIASAVWLGVQLARLGYRPVPLYNAIPDASAATVCDVQPIVNALAAVTADLDKLNLPFQSPPVFLLDAQRRIRRVKPSPGMFDNRSVSLPTDFPSANLLLSRGVEKVIVVQTESTNPQEDLSHTLLRWQQAGIEMFAVAMNAPTLKKIQIVKPRWYRIFWQRLLATAGLRRNPLGGFGGTLPIPSEGGYGGVG